MNGSNILRQLQGFANAPLFEVGGRSVTVATLLVGILIVVLSFLVSELLQKALVRALDKRGLNTEQGAGAAGRLIHYTLVIAGVVIALQTAGIEFGALFTAGAVFAVGLGFAMQNIAQNFVSGVILLVERSIRPGDILELDGKVVKVIQMGIRATLVSSLDEETLIVPNSSIVQSTVKSLTWKDPKFRLRVVVGVHYSSDMHQVARVLALTATKLSWREPEPTPRVILSEFGDSAVNWEVSVWTKDSWSANILRGKMRLAIWDAFARESITIAFPQLDVHLDPSIEQVLQQSSSSRSLSAFKESP